VSLPPVFGRITKTPWHEYPVDGQPPPRSDVVPELGPNYERAAWAFSGSQMLMWRVSGMMNRQMMKHTAGTTMG
jgi:hypothetical protein